MDAITLVQQCAPAIEPNLMVRLIRQESGFNPYAIGLDGKAVLRPQPKSYAEAVRTAEALIQAGQTFSVGAAQIHISNVRRLGLSWQQAFDPCTNVWHGQNILQHFHNAALRAGFKGDEAVFATLRGYNSGNINGTVSNGYATAILGSVRTTQIANAQIPMTSSQPMAAPRRVALMLEDGEAVEAFAAQDMRFREDGQSKEFFEN